MDLIRISIIFTLNIYTPLKIVNSLETEGKLKDIQKFSYSRSVRGLQDLISADLEIAQVLRKHLHDLDNDLYLRKASEQYLEDVYKGNGGKFVNRGNFTNVQQAEVIAKNPIASYRTIRRMVTLLPDLVWRATGILEIPGKVSTDYLNRGEPDRTDLDQAMAGILSLHLVYDLDIEAFSNGNISGVLTSAKLDALHCHEIGLYGMDVGGFHAQVIDWLELALNKVTIHGDTTIDKGVIFTDFMEAVKAHDEALKSDLSYESHFYLFNTSIGHLMKTGDISKSKRHKRLAPTNAIGPGKSIHLKDEMDSLGYHTIDYHNLCRGANLQPLEKKSKLICWLEFKAHHRFLIGPMKMEFLAMDPDVVQIYDVVNEKTIQELKDVSEKTMALSKVTVDGVMKEFTGRTSESSWLDHKVYAKDFASLKLIISQLTGLDTTKLSSSESLQIASYTFSGHYVPHLDATVKPDGKGLRIGTFMIYLSDVEVGGFTAFLHLGVAAKPIKGSAVFWHNILRSEQFDYLTLHGACPVVIGHKYVANEWIRYYNQFLTHKCSQDPLERFQVVVNNNSHIIS